MGADGEQVEELLVLLFRRAAAQGAVVPWGRVVASAGKRKTRAIKAKAG